MALKRLDEQFQVKSSTALLPLLRSLLAALEARFRSLEQQAQTVEGVIEDFRGVALQRINETITPLVTDALDRLHQIGRLFSATSATEHTIGGGAKTFFIADEDKDTFVVLEWATIHPAGDDTVGMSGRVLAYDEANGELSFDSVFSFGAGTFDDWVVTSAPPADITHAGRTDDPHLSKAQAVAELRDGITGARDTLKKLSDVLDAAITAAALAAIETVRGGAAPSRDTLQELSALIDTKATPADITAAINALKGAATTAFDTLAEIEAYINSDVSAGAAVTAALAKRVRVDATQAFTNAEKLQGRANISASGVMNDADLVVPDGTRVVAIFAGFTAPRTLTLPAANSLNLGEAIRIISFPNIASPNTLTIVTKAGDSISSGSPAIGNYVFTGPVDLEFVTNSAAVWAQQPLKAPPASVRSALSLYTQAEVDARDRRRNYIINPAMMVAQEGTGVLVTATAYPVDQWCAHTSSPGGVLKAQQIATPSPAGSPNRLQFTVTTAGTPAAGGWAQAYQTLEGSEVVDLRFGSASAKTVLLRIGVRFPAGTYGVSLVNEVANRSWVGNFTISGGEAGTDVLRSFLIPGDTTGTWATGNVAGITVRICLAAGASLQGALGWQAGNFQTTSAQTNGLASTSNVFHLFDVGLYDATNLVAGTIPPFEVPFYSEEIRRCQRWFYRHPGDIPGGIWVSATRARAIVTFPVIMRAAPTFSATLVSTNAGTVGGELTVTAISSASLRASSAQINFDVASGGVAGQGTYVNNFSSPIDFSARL